MSEIESKKRKTVEGEGESKAKKEKKSEAQWWDEPIKGGIRTRTKMVRKIASTKSPFQSIEVMELQNFGKILALDGFTQSAQADEFIYHECLVHPAMLQHPDPQTVFIGGGGEMATAREVLRHKSVKKLIMCDIDKKVVDLSCEFLPEWGGVETFKDPRFECHYDDAKKFIEEYKGKFDVVIMDIADPIEAGPGIALYFQEFYQTIVSRMNPNGIFVTQSGPAGLLTHKECFTTINRTLASVFDHVVPLSAHVPSFFDHWGWNIAYNKHESLERDLAGKSVETIDKLVADRITGELGFYDGIGHRAIFAFSKYGRKSLAEETRVMTKLNPVFMDSEYADERGEHDGEKSDGEDHS